MKVSDSAMNELKEELLRTERNGRHAYGRFLFSGFSFMFFRGMFHGWLMLEIAPHTVVRQT